MMVCRLLTNMDKGLEKERGFEGYFKGKLVGNVFKDDGIFCDILCVLPG